MLFLLSSSKGEPKILFWEKYHDFPVPHIERGKFGRGKTKIFHLKIH